MLGSGKRNTSKWRSMGHRSRRSGNRRMMGASAMAAGGALAGAALLRHRRHAD
jgi:hypothetical protein